MTPTSGYRGRTQRFFMRLEFEKDGYRLSLADSEDDLRDAQALRYRVFVGELGAGGQGVDHEAGLEADRFDAFADHLILRETGQGALVGVYRLMTAEQAAAAGGFYSEGEYDLGRLISSGRKLLELGRSCVDPAHRSGAALFHLWSGLAQYVNRQGAELLFGTASLPGTDMAALAGPLSLLHHRYLAPEPLRPRARSFQPMDLLDEASLDRRSAMVALPALIKAYLRLGGMVGEGAFIDRAFNCTDVCMVMDTATLNERQARLYSQAAQA